MRVWFVLIVALASFVGDAFTAPVVTNTTNSALALAPAATTGKKVFVLPIRDDIMPPLVYLVRRGVKAAMEAKADLLILDMETNGGRVDTTREIIAILGEFKGETASLFT